MYNNNFSFPSLGIKKKKSHFTSIKAQCIKLEKDIFNFINFIRRYPSKIISFFIKALKSPDYDPNFETEEIFDYINNISQKEISLPPLIEISELNKISYDLLNYLINNNKIKGRIKYNDLDEDYINLRKRAEPYGRIKGKYYEAIVLDSTDLLEIISYILKDIKGRNVLFNENIKYIGIACGFFERLNIENDNNLNHKEKSNKICTIIDLVQDFELNDISMNNNTFDLINETFENNSSDIFTKLNTLFSNNIHSKNKNNEKSKSTDKVTERIKKYRKLTKDTFKLENIKLKRITENKPISKFSDSNYTTTYSSHFYFPKSNSNRFMSPLASFRSNIKNKKLFFNSKLNKNKEKNLSNLYTKNSSFYSSEQNFTKKMNKKKHIDKFSSDWTSENKETNNSASFSKVKNSQKKLNREEKIELLKQINRVCRDKSKTKKSNIKSDDESKSVTISFNTKKNISNDISSSEFISNDNEKKLKDEKEIKNILKNQLKNEIKKEIEKEVKEELISDLISKILVNNALKNKIPNLKIPINNNININGNSYEHGIINNTNFTEGKNFDYNTIRSISSLDLFLPPNKKLATNSNDKTSPRISNIDNNFKINKNNQNYNDKFIMKKFVKLYNVINSNKKNIKQNDKNKSFINYNNKNIYYKIPIMNKSIYSNTKKLKRFIYENKNYIQNNISNSKKIIKINNNYINENINSAKSNSPKGERNKLNGPFRKIIVKNNNNSNNNSNIINYKKISLDKMIKVPKKIIEEYNYFDNSISKLNNKSNIIYVKQRSPNRIPSFRPKKIYEKKIKFVKFNKDNI